MTIVLVMLFSAYAHSLMAQCNGIGTPQPNNITFKNTGTAAIIIDRAGGFGGGSSGSLAVNGTWTTYCNGGSPQEFTYSGGGTAAITVTSAANGGTYYTATLSGGFAITFPQEVLAENYWGTESPQKTYSSGCSGLTYNLGAGAYQDIALQANTYYDFTWNKDAGTLTGGISAYKVTIV